MAYQDGDFGPYGGFAYLDRNGLPLPQPDFAFAADWGNGAGAAAADPSQGNGSDASAPIGADPDRLASQIAQAKDAFVSATQPVQQANALWQLGSLIMAASQKSQQGGGSGGGGGNPPQPAAPFLSGQDQQNPLPFAAALAGALQQPVVPRGPSDGGNGNAQPPLPPPMLGQVSDDGGNGGSGIPLLPSDQQGPPPFAAELPGAPGGAASALQQLGAPQGSTAPSLRGGNSPQPPASLFTAPAPGDKSGGAQPGGLFGPASQPAGPALPPDQQSPLPSGAALDVSGIGAAGADQGMAGQTPFQPAILGGQGTSSLVLTPATQVYGFSGGAPLGPQRGVPQPQTGSGPVASGPPSAPPQPAPTAPPGSGSHGAQQQPPPPQQQPVAGLLDAQGNVNRDVLGDRIERFGERSRQSQVSPAGAIGVMQIMPDLAPEIARRHNIQLDDHRYRTDAAYNRMLGRLHVNDLLDTYNGDPVLATAAYNAGPGNVRRWIRQFGNPSTGEISDADFARSIPFRETRAYIQRVVYGQVPAQHTRRRHHR